LIKNLCLALKILSYFSGGEVPNLDEAIHAASYQILTVGGKSRAFNVRLLSEFDLLGHLSGILFIFNVLHGSFTTEQIDGRTLWKYFT